jgi:hypothetical protein
VRGRGKRPGAAGELPRIWAATTAGLEGRWWWAAAKAWEGVDFFFFFQTKPNPFLIKQTNLNSNQDLNPNTQKQCTGMNATHTTIYLRKDFFSYTIFPVKKNKIWAKF